MKPVIIIFGITGDLSRRKLIPALRKIHASGAIGEFDILGVSRQKVDVLALVGEELASLTSILSLDLAEPADYTKLHEVAQVASGRPVLVYLSVPPLAVTQITRFLGKAGFSASNVKLLLEKPFGVDSISAREMVDELTQYFDELNVYRIDHYLAKEMAQNIVAFRASNALFARAWNREFIEKIEVIASEKIGIEGRVEFYEQTGALRDVLQGHLMQLLSLVITRLPDHLDWNELPTLRAEALESLYPALPSESVRGQYESYRDEVNNDHSMVETYVSAVLHSREPQWRDVDFVLSTGKGLAEKTTEVRVYFRKTRDAQANCLQFRIQPNEGVDINLYAKRPGYDREFDAQTLSFSYPPDKILPDAYEQVLVDAMRANKSIFASSAEILASWRALQPILDAWDMDTQPLHIYNKGATIGDDYQPR